MLHASSFHADDYQKIKKSRLIKGGRLLTRLPPVIQDRNPKTGFGPLQRLHVAALASYEQIPEPVGTQKITLV